MTDFKLQIIPKPPDGTAAVLMTDKKGKFTFIKGSGADNMLCGSCGCVLIESLDRSQIRGVVFKCANCGEYNLT